MQLVLMNSEKNTTYNVQFLNKKSIAKDISKIPKRETSMIMEKISSLTESGSQHAQVKRLKNYPVADFRLKIWSYRILFNVNEYTKKITIIRILHRSQLY